MHFHRSSLTKLWPAFCVALGTSGCSLAFDVDELQDGAGGATSSTSGSTSGSTTGTGGKGAGGGAGGLSPYADAVLASNPMAFYRFDDADDPFKAVDLIAGADGIYTGNGRRAVDGAIPSDPSQAIHFDGASFVQLPNLFEFGGLAAFSVEFWFRAEVLDTTQFMVSNDSGGSPTRHGYTTLIFGDNAVGIERWNADLVIGAVMPPGTVVSGTWYHYVATFDGIRHQVYVQGVLGSSFNDSLALVPDGQPAFVGDGFKGDVDELAFYDRALSATEVGKHATAK